MVSLHRHYRLTDKYLLMEKLGRNWFQHYYGKVASLRDAVAMGKEMMRILHVLHEHGDIHSGNFLLTSRKGLKLIDFGRAYFDSNELEEMVRAPLSENHSIYSPWEIWRIGALYEMDDVFKVLLIVADLMTGFAVRNVFETRGKDIQYCLDVKMKMLFSSTKCNRPIDKLVGASCDVKSKIKIEFDNILRKVRGLVSINDIRDYAGMIKHFDHILWDLSPSRQLL